MKAKITACFILLVLLASAIGYYGCKERRERRRAYEIIELDSEALLKFLEESDNPLAPHEIPDEVMHESLTIC